MRDLKGYVARRRSGDLSMQRRLQSCAAATSHIPLKPAVILWTLPLSRKVASS